MTRVAIDTNVLVAAALPEHPHHSVAFAELERRVASDELVFPVHALLEAFSVLTRIPLPERLAPPAALALLRDFAAAGEVVTLPAARCMQLLEAASATGMAGGRIYDSVIADCARLAGAKLVVTLNVRHFREVAPDLEIQSP